MENQGTGMVDSKENKATVRLSTENWDFVWDEVARLRKAGETKVSFNTVVNAMLDKARNS